MSTDLLDTPLTPPGPAVDSSPPSTTAGSTSPLVEAPATKPRDLTEFQRETIARRHVLGATPLELGPEFNLTPTQMRGLLETEGMRTLMSRHTQQFKSAGEDMYFQFCLVGKTIGERMAQRAMTDSDPHCFAAQKFIATTLLPKRETHGGELTVNHVVSGNVTAKLDAAVTSIGRLVETTATAMPAFTQFLRHGTEGIATDAETTPVEPTVPTADTGPGASSTQEATNLAPVVGEPEPGGTE